MATGICENCARDDNDIEPVHRRYVIPEAWDTQGSDTVMPEIEHWCFSCRSQYPHAPAESDESTDDAVDPADAPSS